ncbi:ABC transporter permease [Acidobacteria bacterium AB60]|nr:ABC transporter permease [Acidobacteria bacterium AB60]
MIGDLKQAWRQFGRSPGFTATAVITLALGIGATTAIFTLVQQVMLRSLPVSKPDELWRIGKRVHCCGYGGYTQPEEFSIFSYDLYRQFRDHTPEFVDLAALQGGSAGLGVRRAGSQQQMETFNGQFVSGNFFQTFGVGAWAGRVLQASDESESASPVAVMSYHVWKDKFGSDPSVVGATYEINGHPFTLVGIGAPGFFGAKMVGWGMPDFWLPVTTEPLLDGKSSRLKLPSQHWLDLIGRVRPGTDARELEARLRVELHDWQASHVAEMVPQEKEIWQQQKMYVSPGGAGVAAMKEQYEEGLKLLLGAAGCVLLVACANIANLLLARGLRNRQQTSVRIALGASQGRLVRTALVESVGLSLLGGALGVAVAYGGTRLMVYLAFKTGSSHNYVPLEATPSWPVLLFALGLSVLTGILFGMVPAWMTSHAEPVEALRGARSTTGNRVRWPQRALVVAQAAMSLVLLSAAALLGSSLRNLEHQDFGFELKDHYVAWVDPRMANLKAEQMPALYDRIRERIGAIPGVRAVSAALYAPMSGDSWNTGVLIDGKPEPSAKDHYEATFVRVTPGFFESLGNPIVMGRSFNDGDKGNTHAVAVVNEAFVNQFFKNENPIGKHFGVDKRKYAGIFEIVGVARNTRYVTFGMKDPPRPMFFMAEGQFLNFDEPEERAGDATSHFLSSLIVWAPGNPPNLEAQVRRALNEIEPNLALHTVDPYTRLLDAAFAQEKMMATLTLLFGGLGLVLAAVGLYGVTAYGVEQRTTEIGVRMALGADRGSVVGMVLRSAFWQVGVGLLLGVPAAVGAGRLLTDKLYGVEPWDLRMLGGAVLCLGLATLVAGWIPARRASNLDPVEALRAE